MVRKLILFLAAAAAIAQTRVQPGQIKNIEQVRIYFGDKTPEGTRVLVRQISDGRYIVPPDRWAIERRNYQWCNAIPPGCFIPPGDCHCDPPADPGDLVVPVCIVDWYGIGVPPEYTTRIVKSGACYTARSLATLHKDPDWDAWLKARGF